LPALNLSGHRTSLSGPARAQKPLLPTIAISPTRDRHGGVGMSGTARARKPLLLTTTTSPTGDHRGEVGVLALMCL
jgi:hypothetical protein